MLIIASLSLCTIIVIIHISTKLTYWSKRGIKSPPTHPIFGNFTFKKPPGQVIQEIYDSADPTDPFIGFYVFHSPKLLLRDLDLIKHLFIKDSDVFANRCFGGAQQKDILGLASIFSVHQPIWAYARHKLSAGLTGSKLHCTMPLVEERLAPMMRFIEEQESDEDGWKRLEVKDIASRYSTDVLASLALGISVDSFDKTDCRFWENGQNILVGRTRGAIQFVFFFLPGLTKFIQPFITGPVGLLRRIFWSSVKARETAGMKRGDLIDHFVGLKNGQQNLDYPFQGDNLLAQAEAIFVGGYESTATMIAFTLYELSRRPAHEERLHNEIATIMAGSREISSEKLKEMTFLDQIVNEVLRLYPSLPFVDRVAEKDYKIPGSDVPIEKGTAVYVSLNGLNRDPKYFERPDEFDPTRPRVASADLPSTSLSFGIGQHTCIGQRLALIMAKIAVIGILMEYTLAREIADDAALESLSVFTVAGIRLKLKRRM